MNVMQIILLVTLGVIGYVIMGTITTAFVTWELRDSDYFDAGECAIMGMFWFISLPLLIIIDIVYVFVTVLTNISERIEDYYIDKEIEREEKENENE